MGEDVQDYVVKKRGKGECNIAVLNQDTFYLYSPKEDYNISAYFKIYEGRITKVRKIHGEFDFATESGLIVRAPYIMSDDKVIYNQHDSVGWWYNSLNNHMLQPHVTWIDRLDNALIYDEKLNKCRVLVQHKPISSFVYQASTYTVVTKEWRTYHVWDERYNKQPINVYCSKSSHSLSDGICGDYMYSRCSEFMNYKTGEIVESEAGKNLYRTFLITPDLCEYSHCRKTEVTKTQYAFV